MAHPATPSGLVARNYHEAVVAEVFRALHHQGIGGVSLLQPDQGMANDIGDDIRGARGVHQSSVK